LEKKAKVLDIIFADPIVETIKIINTHKKNIYDIREWIPIYATIANFFFARKKLNKHQISTIEKDAYNLEINYQQMNSEQIENSNVLPRMLNKYIWILDYYEFQEYNFQNVSQVRDRLIKLEPNLFKEFFKNSSKRK